MGAPKGNQNARKYKDAEELQILIDKYFDECESREVPFTMSGLAYSLGIDRNTLINMGKEELFFAQIKNAKEKVQQQMEENALMGKANPTFSIFSLKNNYGWKDQQEIKTTQEVNVSPLESAFDKLNEANND